MESKAEPKLFVWNGIDWTPAQIARRLWWFAAAFLLTLLAVPIFDRFDEAPAAMRRRRSKRGKMPDLDPASIGNSTLSEQRPSGLGERIGRAISALSAVGASSRFGRLLAAEIRLTLKGVHTGWYLVAAGLAIASALSPADAVKHYLLPVAWLWPALLWSKMGMREAWFGTGQLIFSSPRIRGAQLLAVWGSGVLVAALTGSGALLNFAVGGDWGAVAGALAGVVFIPSLALVCGVWSAGSKFFEALYGMWWYVGPMNNTPALDFTGGSSTPATAVWYAVAAAACILAADAGRRRQMAG
jgi:hypothetical protein